MNTTLLAPIVRGVDDIPAGSFHGNDELPVGTWH